MLNLISLQLEANATGVIRYVVIVFATQSRSIVDAVDQETNPDTVIRKLKDIAIYRGKWT